LPEAAEPILMAPSMALTQPSFQRLLALTVGAILTGGPRTVLRMLSTLGPLAPGPYTDYHRLFSRAPWSTWKLGRVIARLVLDLVPPGEPVIVPMDDTVLERKGDQVYAKGCYRCRESVLRTTACLFGSFSLVTLIYHEHQRRHSVRLIERPGYLKREPTFADALATVRELFWTETIFEQPQFRRVWKKVPRRLRRMLLKHLCQAV